MDSLKRAKDYLARKASKLALAAVPLAALAVATPVAHAGTLLSTPSSCFAGTNGSGSCSVFEAGPVGGNSNLNWLQLSGTGTAPVSGGFVDFFGSGGATGVLPGGSVPISWDFFVTSPVSGGTNVSWGVFFALDGNFGFVSYSGSGVALTDTEITGTAFLTIPSGGNVTDWAMSITTSGSTTYSLNVPGGASLDLNPTSATPEPATIALTVAGSGLILLLRRRKRA
ncbi:MAG: PEP-CTERM sorting domain-containing protein [Acidobacteriia bacterium]|nr:PEP-CTERM sorting domain-containing protein [Terriglobia bacterium]